MLEGSRGAGVAGSLDSQVTRPQLVSVTAFCIDRCGVTIHTHQVVSETTTTTRCLTQACQFLCGVLSVMMGSEQVGTGAAQRRRQRRLRSWLRHERMTVAMALTERTHHSSRGQTIARAGVWGARDELHGHHPGFPPLPPPPLPHTHTHQP